MTATKEMFCGNCNARVTNYGYNFGVVVTDSTLKRLTICKKCCKKIPESLRATLDHALLDRGSMNVYSSENNYIVFAVRQNTVKFCLPSIGQKFWPRQG